MNLGSILSTLYDRLGYDQTPDAADTRRLTAYVNEIQRETLAKKGMSTLRKRVIPFSTISGNSFAVTAQAMAQVWMCGDMVNDRIIYPKDMSYLWTIDPGRAMSGPPQWFAIADYSSPTILDPSAATELFIVSTAAGDTQNVYLEGVTSGGYVRSVGPIALTGTTPKSLGATITDWTSVNTWWLSSAAAGFVSITEGSGGTTLGTISIGQSKARYTKLQLQPQPASVQTLFAYGLIDISDMVATSDEPIIIPDFHRILVHGAMQMEFTKREKPSLSASCERKKEMAISELRNFLSTPQSFQSRMPQGWNNLGWAFPASVGGF